MPIKTRLTTQGFEEYLERIANAGLKIDAIAEEALTEGAVPLQDGMRQRVAKDTHNLEHHIVIEGPYKDGNFLWVEIGLAKNTDANTARYGNVQEFGSANTDAHPYVRPTLDKDMAKARKIMKAVYLKALAGL